MYNYKPSCLKRVNESSSMEWLESSNLKWKLVARLSTIYLMWIWSSDDLLPRAELWQISRVRYWRRNQRFNTIAYNVYNIYSVISYSSPIKYNHQLTSVLLPYQLLPVYYQVLTSVFYAVIPVLSLSGCYPRWLHLSYLRLNLNLTLNLNTNLNLTYLNTGVSRCKKVLTASTY